MTKRHRGVQSIRSHIVVARRMSSVRTLLFQCHTIMKFSYMFLEIKVPTKSFLAYAARVWLLFIVCMHVEREIVHLVESLITYITLVLLLRAVREFMVLVIPFLVKAFTAEFAREWLVIQVNTHVCVKRAATVECLAACFTFVWLLLGVDDLMATQCTGLSKSFPTNFADKWSCT